VRTGVIAEGKWFVRDMPKRPTPGGTKPGAPRKRRRLGSTKAPSLVRPVLGVDRSLISTPMLADALISKNLSSRAQKLTTVREEQIRRLWSRW
jgi:hypothetical protein